MGEGPCAAGRWGGGNAWAGDLPWSTARRARRVLAVSREDREGGQLSVHDGAIPARGEGRAERCRKSTGSFQTPENGPDHSCHCSTLENDLGSLLYYVDLQSLSPVAWLAACGILH